ncbi:hypothetical protein OAL67_00495 [bacterium]|nr:hypothetical protein [bacterium]
MFTVPSSAELEAPLKKVFPIGNGYQGLSYRLGRNEGTQLVAEGILRWILYGLSDEGMTLGMGLTVPKIIKEIVTVPEIQKEVLELAAKYLEK